MTQIGNKELVGVTLSQKSARWLKSTIPKGKVSKYIDELIQEKMLQEQTQVNHQ